MQQVSSSDTKLLKHNMKPDNKNDNQVSLGLGGGGIINYSGTVT